MKIPRKPFPAWLPPLLDLLCIAVFVLGFYGVYYLVPRQLSSSGVYTTPLAASSNSSSQSGQESSSVSPSTIFTDKFTDTVVSTANSYSSDDISVTVTKHTTGTGSSQVTYFVADIYISDVQCLQSGFAGGTYGVGYTESVLSMDQSLGAVLAMNGDYYGNGGSGVVIRNGEVYRTGTGSSDICVLYYDGTMKTYSAGSFDAQQAVSDGAWQAWDFGPSLLDENGGSISSFHTSGNVSGLNPRSAIGYYEPGHYCMVVVDGRQNGYSRGMELKELSQLFHELGCTAAYNLDGGKSSVMTFNDSVVNQPASGGRAVSDCIILKEVG